MQYNSTSSSTVVVEVARRLLLVYYFTTTVKLHEASLEFAAPSHHIPDFFSALPTTSSSIFEANGASSITK